MKEEVSYDEECLRPDANICHTAGQKGKGQTPHTSLDGLSLLFLSHPSISPGAGGYRPALFIVSLCLSLSLSLSLLLPLSQDSEEGWEDSLWGEEKKGIRFRGTKVPREEKLQQAHKLSRKYQAYIQSRRGGAFYCTLGFASVLTDQIHCVVFF